MSSRSSSRTYQHSGVPGWVLKQNYTRADTPTATNAKFVAAQNSIDIVKAWGGGKVASADGMRHKASATTTKRKQKSAAAMTPRLQAANNSARHTRTARKKEGASAINPDLLIDSGPNGGAEVERTVQYEQIGPPMPSVNDVRSPIETSADALPLPLQSLQFVMEVQRLVARTMMLPWLLFPWALGIGSSARKSP